MMQGLGYNFKADIWSAGVLLFSMLSGLSIFEGESDEQICHSVLKQPTDLESEPWPFVSQGAKDLLSRSVFFHYSPATQVAGECLLSVNHSKTAHK